ncbi:MAG: GIY-YIG nuclease family protein [Cyanobacteria bacterium P01_A01_bin.84]
MKGLVYLLNAVETNRYKIGFTTREVTDRIRGISYKQQPFEIVQVHYVECDEPRDVETKLHKKFADYRAKGEWFDFDNVQLVIDEMNKLAKFDKYMFAKHKISYLGMQLLELAYRNVINADENSVDFCVYEDFLEVMGVDKDELGATKDKFLQLLLEIKNIGRMSYNVGIRMDDSHATAKIICLGDEIIWGENSLYNLVIAYMMQKLCILFYRIYDYDTYAYLYIPDFAKKQAKDIAKLAIKTDYQHLSVDINIDDINIDYKNHSQEVIAEVLERIAGDELYCMSDTNGEPHRYISQIYKRVGI